MSKRVRIAAISAFVAITTTSVVPATAGSVAGNGGATEVTQILNNAELAMQTIQEAMIETQAKLANYYAMLQQAPIGVSEFSVTANDIHQKYQSATGMYQQLTGLYGSVGNLQNFAQQRFQAFAASGLDWNSYVQREQAMIQGRNDQYGFLNVQERSAITGVQKNYDAIQRYQGQIGSTTGTHGAMTVMNGQMNTLLGQINQMLEQMAIHNNVETNVKQVEFAESRRAVDDGRGFAKSFNQSIFDAIQTRK